MRITLRTVEVPEEPPEIDGTRLTALRTQAAMSQSVFARLLNASTKTLQSWEQGVRQPSDASHRLLQVFSEQPEMHCKIVGLPEISLSGVQTQRTASGQRQVVIVNRSSKPSAAGKSGRAHQPRAENTAPPAAKSQALLVTGQNVARGLVGSSQTIFEIPIKDAILFGGAGILSAGGAYALGKGAGSPDKPGGGDVLPNSP